ncbi:MAG TPA: hypothetical protein PLS53_16275 [Thermoanaerobaculaceae bacterium]|nr:hypothetical protein [Thermoanaerobaculaceae bacterium]
MPDGRQQETVGADGEQDERHGGDNARSHEQHADRWATTSIAGTPDHGLQHRGNGPRLGTAATAHATPLRRDPESSPVGQSTEAAG